MNFERLPEEPTEQPHSAILICCFDIALHSCRRRCERRTSDEDVGRNSGEIKSKQTFLGNNVICNKLKINSLIEQHYIRLPHFVCRQSEELDSVIIGRIPFQLVVIPLLVSIRDEEGE